MPSKAAILAHVQALADAQGGNQQIALGTPGAVVRNSAGELRTTGQAWVPEPRTLALIAEGIARAEGVGRVLTQSGPLLSGDCRLELGANDVVVTLPAAGPQYIGAYQIKSLGTSGGLVVGDIDGGTGVTLFLHEWSCQLLVCNGTQWLTVWPEVPS